MENNLKKKQQPKKKNPFRFFVFDFVKWTGAIPVFIWLRNKYIYESNSAKKKIRGGAIVYSNHLGCIDPLILHTTIWYRRLHLVAMKELFETKARNWFFRKVLCIPIDRQNIRVSSFKDIINVLKDQRVVAIFPEGHINISEQAVDAFKSGMVLMAMQANVSIVPMVIIKRKKWWHRQRIVIGDPISLPKEHMNLEEINNFSELLRKKEYELLEFYDKGAKK